MQSIQRTIKILYVYDLVRLDFVVYYLLDITNWAYLLPLNMLTSRK